MYVTSLVIAGGWEGDLSLRQQLQDPECRHPGLHVQNEPACEHSHARRRVSTGHVPVWTVDGGRGEDTRCVPG